MADVHTSPRIILGRAGPTVVQYVQPAQGPKIIYNATIDLQEKNIGTRTGPYRP
jgi:hypothetical protein